MSKKVVLLGDLGTDHSGFPPTPVTAGSSDVLIDDKPVARVGDPLAPHSKPKHPPHPRAIAAGSSTVLINGIPAAVTGGAISCGGVTIGSGSVVIGDTYTPAQFSGISPASSQPASQVEASYARSADGGATGSLSSPQSANPNGLARGDSSEVAGGPVVSGVSDQGSKDQTKETTVEPGFHVIQSPMSKTTLVAALYGDASAKPDSFDRLNPGLGSQVLPGEMIVLGDPEGMECTREEADLMEVAAQVNAQVRSLDQDEAQFLVKYHALLEAVTSTSSAGLGAGAVMVSKQIGSIEKTLKNIERLHQESYRKYGHLNHPEFFEKRRALFKELDFSLGSLARKGMSLDDDAKLKRALGLSSKSIVHNWKTAGVGGIPGYATHYERLARGARYARNVGYLGITLDASMSTLKIHEACTSGSERECQVVAYQEGGKFTGSLAGGGIGAVASAATCTVFAVTTAGIGGVACAIIAGGLGAAVGGHAGGVGGKNLGEKLREVIHE
ncbi:type VI secretion system PAAR protein [Marinobacter sp. 71-i]|uniref:Type VI secretion system PAAR protein n=1 Tax=Marinobacter iranensis TaxID=2962607 RepID=A0ABT5YG50_9GAMM|nr:type VI secretion system PAAR protein [Marinobacter iranensis]MDF0752675.1 type VI secretion system PAAR protein [Marinobacter iranensis]